MHVSYMVHDLARHSSIVIYTAILTVGTTKLSC